MRFLSVHSDSELNNSENSVCNTTKIHALYYSLTVSFRAEYAVHAKNQTAGKIVVYRSYFARLLAVPKPLRDQLIIELPTLNGFRTKEAATVQRDHVDLEKGDIQVLDSKKHQLFTVPLDYTVARHIQQFLAITHVTAGLLFTPSRRTKRKHHMTDQAIEWIWRKWCKLSGIPYMAPRYGRAYFAVDWHVVQRKSLIGLMDVLRHTSLLATQKYLSKIRCYEDVKQEFNQGTKSPFISKCARSNSCPLATDGCHCRMFTPRLEVEAK